MPLRRSISEPNHHYAGPDVKVDIKIEQIEEENVCRELLPNVHVKSEPLNWPMILFIGPKRYNAWKRPKKNTVVFRQFKQ